MLPAELAVDIVVERRKKMQQRLTNERERMRKLRRFQGGWDEMRYAAVKAQSQADDTMLSFKLCACWKE